MDIKSSSDFFQDNSFEFRDEAIKFIIEKFGDDKNLIQPYSNKRSSNIICLKCDDITCSFTINCYKQQKKNIRNIFQFKPESSSLVHGEIDPITKSVIRFCSGAKIITSVRYCHYTIKLYSCFIILFIRNILQRINYLKLQDQSKLFRRDVIKTECQLL